MRDATQARRPLQRRVPPRNRLLARESSAARPAAGRKFLRRWLTPVLLLVVGVGLGVYAFPYLKTRISQPVQRVVVEGDLKYLARRELMDHIPVYQGDRWLEVDLNAVRYQIELLPWIYSAQVSRQWPDTIHIQLQEQKPIARWNETQLLNQYGEVFDADGKVAEGLPLLQGMDGSERMVAERFLEFSRLLAPLKLRPVQLQLDQRYAWSVMLDNGLLIKIGNSDAVERMQRFVFLYQKELALAPQPAAVVDLRYGSGAAVQWQAPIKQSG